MKTKWWIPRPSGSMVPTGGYLDTHGTVGNVCRHFWLLQRGGGRSWHLVVVVARDAAQQLWKHRTQRDVLPEMSKVLRLGKAILDKDLHGDKRRCHSNPRLPLISDDLGLQWLKAGFRFQARDWSQAVAGRRLNPSRLTSGQWQGPGPLTL